MLSDILNFQPTKLMSENDVSVMIEKQLSANRRDESKQGNVQDKNNANSSTIAHERHLNLASCGLADVKDRQEEECRNELNFHIYKYNISKQNSFSHTGTNLRSVFESKVIQTLDD